MRAANISTEKLNINNYKSFQTSEEKDDRKEIQIKKPLNILNNNKDIIINKNKNKLPLMKINEPKIINKNIELGYNHVNSLNNINSKNKIEIKKPNLLHSGSQRLIINDSNKKNKNILVQILKI